jgi:hypothetical protein
MIQDDTTEPVQLHTDMKMPTKTWYYLVSLADIDPETIHVVARSQVHFETRNNVDVITEIVSMGEEHSEYDLNFGNFILDSPENAERFASALKHAVILCGGVKSPF